MFLGRPQIFRHENLKQFQPLAAMNQQEATNGWNHGEAPDLELGLGSILLDLHGTGILETFSG